MEVFQKTYITSEDLKNLIRLYGVIRFWVNFAFDSSLGIRLQSKSSFEGVATIIIKLFNIVESVFGKTDYQQMAAYPMNGEALTIWSS
ncbi:hypothetical protein YC2023_054363 [Brassica napus]